jgi:hypothetical protein
VNESFVGKERFRTSFEPWRLLRIFFGWKCGALGLFMFTKKVGKQKTKVKNKFG